jgi:peptide chain release factor 1
MRDIAKEELSEWNRRKRSWAKDSRAAASQDPNDEKDVILEIRAGAGGVRQRCSAQSYIKMYSHYAENRGGRWRSWIPTSPSLAA